MVTAPRRALRTATGKIHVLATYERKGHHHDVAVTLCNAWLAPDIITEAPIQTIYDLRACKACYTLYAKEQTA